MAENKNSFLLHMDSLTVLDDLSDVQAGKLFKAMRAYHSGEEPELPLAIKLAFLPFKNQFLRDDIKYEKACKKNAENIAKRWEKNTKNTTGKNGKNKNTKNTDSDSDSDSDNKKDKDSKNDSGSKKSVFVPPTLDEFVKYFIENKFPKELGERAWKGYHESGWVDSKKNKIHNWKLKCQHVWFKNNETQSKTPIVYKNSEQDYSQSTQESFFNNK